MRFWLLSDKGGCSVFRQFPSLRPAQLEEMAEFPQISETQSIWNRSNSTSECWRVFLSECHGTNLLQILSSQEKQRWEWVDTQPHSFSISFLFFLKKKKRSAFFTLGNRNFLKYANGHPTLVRLRLPIQGNEEALQGRQPVGDQGMGIWEGRCW